MKVLGAMLAIGCSLGLTIGAGGSTALAQASRQPPTAVEKGAKAPDAPPPAGPRTGQRNDAPKPEVEIDESPDSVDGCPFRERKLELIV